MCQASKKIKEPFHFWVPDYFYGRFNFATLIITVLAAPHRRVQTVIRRESSQSDRMQVSMLAYGKFESIMQVVIEELFNVH